jgi:glyoxylase-like metal-dependent hydrolase (beta-lactamase superfamily II)
LSEILEDRARLEHFDCHRGIFRISGRLPALEFRPTISYEPLRGKIWTATEGIYRTLFIEGERGIVAFDTFYSPGAAQSYRLAIGRVFPHKEIDTIVYSHDHLDHTGYARNLSPGAEVIAHEHCAEVVAARRSDGQTVPTTTWAGAETQLERDGVQLRMIYPGQTHGNGNVAVHFPDERLLFMVDTIIPGVGYTFFPDWHMSAYMESMRPLLDLEWDLFVPGHFWPVDRAGFVETLTYFDALHAAAREALVDGVDPGDYAQATAWAKEHLHAYAHLFRFEEYIGPNLMRFMLHQLTGGWGLEDNGA